MLGTKVYDTRFVEFPIDVRSVVLVGIITNATIWLVGVVMSTIAGKYASQRFIVAVNEFQLKASITVAMCFLMFIHLLVVRGACSCSCMEYVWGMFGECFGECFGVCMGYVWSMSGVCLENVWGMSGECLVGTIE